jgi:uncharacterized membrane protein
VILAALLGVLLAVLLVNYGLVHPVAFIAAVVSRLAS